MITETVLTLVTRVKAMSVEELTQYYRDMAHGTTETHLFNAWIAGLELDRRVEEKGAGA